MNNPDNEYKDTLRVARSMLYGTRSEQLAGLMPQEHPLQVDRMQLASFTLRVRETIAGRDLGRCLEWDETFLLNRAFWDVCREGMDAFIYSEPDPKQPQMGKPGVQMHHGDTVRQYWGDLLHPEGLGIEPETFGLIVAPFVFEHVAQPFVGMRRLAEILRPGGYMLWSAPMFQHYHGAPHDYFRYTPKGARELARDAGLDVINFWAPGDLGVTSGVMMGMRLPYWDLEHVLREEPALSGEDSPRQPLNVFMLLQKPSPL